MNGVIYHERQVRRDVGVSSTIYRKLIVTSVVAGERNVRPPRAQQPVPRSRRLHQGRTGRYLLLLVPRRVDKPAQVLPGARQLRRERGHGRSAEEGLRSRLV